jgi:DNA-binding NarL/FixJ family response regulator
MTSRKLIRILIAEDHLIARLGIAAIIRTQPDMKVVAEAIDGHEALTLCKLHRPDIILMDIRMPRTNGTEATRQIREQFPECRVVALSTFGGDEDIRRAFAAGADAYLIKNVLHDELITAIRTVHAGQKYLTSEARAVLATAPFRAELTAREIEVLQLIAQGLINKHIAYALGITEHTVKNHVKNLLEKLDVEDRTEAATVAIQRGIIYLDG